MDRRDGSGSFKRNPRHLHAWSVQQQIVDAYVLWALTESDVASGNPQRSATELVSELDALNEAARKSEDPYLISLAAASMKNAQREQDAEKLFEKLAEKQKPTGELIGQTTVTQSGGISRTVETTALAMLAWSKHPKYSAKVSHPAKWLTKNRSGSGGFGSTQATVLAQGAGRLLQGRFQTFQRWRVVGQAQRQSDRPDNIANSGQQRDDGRDRRFGIEL